MLGAVVVPGIASHGVYLECSALKGPGVSHAAPRISERSGIVAARRSAGMPPLDDPFYARLLTLSDAELCTYLQLYTHYKAEAVHAALAELRLRGVYVSKDTVAEINRYFTRHEQ